MASITETLSNYEKGALPTKHDPGKIIILFDNRISKTTDDKFSYLQSYKTDLLFKLGWPSFYGSDLDPGFIRLVWYTVSLPC